jgi:release factor glutamine methyltransferase
MNETELVFTEILNCSRMSLYLDKNLKWDKDKSIAVSSIIKRRIQGEPLQYIFGKTEFMGLEFRVSPDVFIPRPETEILAEEVMELTRGLAACQTRRIQILDMGTGSGCIAVSLAKLLPLIKMHAVDISARALEIAQYNARMHNVKVNFIHSDLFNSCGLKPDGYDIIVTNPPYIPKAQINKLEAEVKYEPAIALEGGDDGLDFYRRIIAQAPSYLRVGGILAMEMGFNQAGAIRNIFRDSGDFKIIKVVKDYSRIERVITAKKVE